MLSTTQDSYVRTRTVFITQLYNKVMTPYGEEVILYEKALTGVK
jgi:hypothetical protein